jgi:hypothetical protein
MRAEVLINFAFYGVFSFPSSSLPFCTHPGRPFAFPSLISFSEMASSASLYYRSHSVN